MTHDARFHCPGCNSLGFDQSKLGPDRCTFCDGTEGGNPPCVLTVREWYRIQRGALWARRDQWAQPVDRIATLVVNRQPLPESCRIGGDHVVVWGDIRVATSLVLHYRYLELLDTKHRELWAAQMKNLTA